MIYKKGLSRVVATVLIILIIIAVVAILWAGVFSMIKSEAFLSSQSDIDLTIDTIGGYTYWDQDLREACVRVKRGADDIYLTKINVLFSIKGNSVEDSFTKLPQAGGAVMECFGPYPFKPDSVKVVPIFIRGNVEVSGSAFEGFFEKDTGSGGGSDDDWDGNETSSCGDGVCDFGDNFENCPGDCPVCDNMCGDDLCPEKVCLGSGCPCPESWESCPGDCPGPVCGNKECEDGETIKSCPGDCSELEWGDVNDEHLCGDGICWEEAENYKNCPGDCT